MTDIPMWDWHQEERAIGVAADRRYNLATLALPSNGPCLVWDRADGSLETYTGDELHAWAAQISALLHELGIRRGDRVAGLMGRRPEVFATALAVWRLGAIYVPLFTGFGDEGLRVRIEDSGVKTAVVDSQNRGALSSLQESGIDLQVLVIGGQAESDDVDVDALLEQTREVPDVADTPIDDPATIMYTSGTTGRPKGCTMPHGAVLALAPYVRHCLRQAPGDVLFAGADAGWSFGLLTTGFAPMTAGVARVIYEGPFDARGWWSSVERTGASHVAAAPTAFRKLAAAGAQLVPEAFGAATSAGEPMDAATNDWFVQNTGVHIHDSYGLSELGMVTANLRGPAAPEPVSGSMGVALPGFDVRLIDNEARPIDGEGTGRLAVRDHGHLLSNGYWGRMDEWKARFEDDWFVTEDVVTRRADGRYEYVARNDDIIVASGYNVGPGEVETALMAHPSIVDAAVVGHEPADGGGTVVAAHVVLAGDEPQDLTTELRRWVGDRVGWHAAPRQVQVHAALPRTASGKVMRRQLRDPAGGGSR